MFDPPENQPYANIGIDQINAPDHQALALQAARESIVLLQNDGALPLDMSKKVALIGPNADATGTMQGNYHGTAPFLISPQEGLQKIGASVTYVQGCDVGCSSDSGFADAVNAAKAAEVVVVVVGLDQHQERYTSCHDNKIILRSKLVVGAITLALSQLRQSTYYILFTTTYFQNFK